MSTEQNGNGKTLEQNVHEDDIISFFALLKVNNNLILLPKDSNLCTPCISEEHFKVLYINVNFETFADLQ